MAQYHWYFVWAAYGITAMLSIAVLVHSWQRMAKAERRVESEAKTPSNQNNAVSHGIARDSRA